MISASSSETTNLTKFLKAVELEKRFKYHVNVRGIIPPQNLALLIGPHGSNLLLLSRKSDVLLTLSESKKRNRQRVFNVNGQPTNCANAWTTYLQTCTRDDPNSIYSVDFILPNEYIMYAERKNLFEKIALKSKAEIRIGNHCLPNSTERIVKISIKSKRELEYFYTAVKLLAQHAHEHPKIVMSFPGTVFYDKTDDDDDDEIVQNLSNESKNVVIYNPLY